jgi:hypothetical protein
LVTQAGAEHEPTPELDVTIETETEAEAHDSAIIETAEEVEVPDAALAPHAQDSRIEGPVSEPPLSGPPLSDRAELFPPRVAVAHSDVPPPNLAALTFSSPTPSAAASISPPPAGSHAPSPSSPSWSERAKTAPERVIALLPPRAVTTARNYPVLWLVAAPVLLASLLVSIAVVSGPEPRLQAAAKPAQVTPIRPSAAPASPPAPAAEATRPGMDASALSSLAAKDPTSLSVSDLLFLDEGRAERQRAEVQALARKLQAEPDVAKDASSQASLLRFALDPATASEALAAMALAPSPIGPDLLFEVWTNRATPSATAELARSLLYSHDVRPGASAALGVALDLRSADSCAAVKATLPKVQASADKRAIPTLIKLTYRRGCGKGKREDCYACLRSSPRELFASTKAADGRRAPSYGVIPR